MAEENKTVELTEEDLKKVSGGNNYYTKGQPKRAEGCMLKEYWFLQNDFYKITKVGNFINEWHGYSYSVDLYYDSEIQVKNYGELDDDYIDSFLTPYTKQKQKNSIYFS